MKLGEICTIKYDTDHKALADGSIPVYGTGGIMRYADRSLSSGPSVLIPRKGTLSNLFFVDSPFWTVDTLFWTTIDENAVLPKYLYYALKTRNLAELNVGTAVPSLTVELLNDVEIDLPTYEQQERIINLLSSLDAKITFNSRINDHLALWA